MSDPENLIKEEVIEDEPNYILPDLPSNDLIEENSPESQLLPNEGVSSMGIKIKREVLSDSSDLDQDILPINDETLIQNTNTARESRNFNCEQCSYGTNVKCTLKRHMLTHSNDKPFKCDECSFTSRRKHNLLQHKVIHSTGKVFKCDQCSYTCNWKGNLKKHESVHSTRDKQYKCDKCPYATSQKLDLSEHKSIHKRFQCVQCDYVSKSKRTLSNHMVIHSTDKPFKCDHCTYASRRKGDLKIHACLAHSTNKYLKCDQCTYTSTSKVHIEKHKMTHSNSVVNEVNKISESRATYSRKKKVGLVDEIQTSNQFETSQVLDESERSLNSY